MQNSEDSIETHNVDAHENDGHALETFIQVPALLILAAAYESKL